MTKDLIWYLNVDLLGFFILFNTLPVGNISHSKLFRADPEHRKFRIRLYIVQHDHDPPS